MSDSDASHERHQLDRLLSGMDGPARDSDLLAVPPQGLFERIEDAASVPVTVAPMVVEYSVDRDDMLISTGGDWDTFAADNDGEELAGTSRRLSLWSQIQGQDAQNVWKLVLSEVRRTHAEAMVPLRCDAPDMRRWYEIDVAAGDNGAVDFRSRLVFEETRPDVSLIRRGSERTPKASAVQLCCWCARGFDGNRWLSIDELVWSNDDLEHEPVPEISQGICGECKATMSSEAERLANT
ncbi:MAG: hypothetical protein ACR2OH_15020 [Microthrixaceae bacterium]